MSEAIQVPKLTLQIVFDAAVESMDFGSGFLDTEEVDNAEMTVYDWRQDDESCYWPITLPTAEEVAA